MFFFSPNDCCHYTSSEEGKPQPTCQASLLPSLRSVNNYSVTADTETYSLCLVACVVTPSSRIKWFMPQWQHLRSPFHCTAFWSFTHLKKQHWAALAEISIKIKIQLLLPLSIFYTLSKTSSCHVAVHAFSTSVQRQAYLLSKTQTVTSVSLLASSSKGSTRSLSWML